MAAQDCAGLCRLRRVASAQMLPKGAPQLTHTGLIVAGVSTTSVVSVEEPSDRRAHSVGASLGSAW